VRAEIHWVNPFGPDEMANEVSAETTLYGLLYDSLTYRGGINLAAGVRPGNVLQGTSRAGAGSAGLPVTAKGEAKLLSTERFDRSAPIEIELVTADGLTVLAAKTLPVTGTIA
jgi:hypothetical protein